MSDIPRLSQLYKKKLPKLKEELALSNDLAVPKIIKIVVNAGIGKLLQQQPKALDSCIEAYRKITGQQPVLTHAKKAISGFKIRQGQVIGLMVTLRGKRMYEFLDKLINVVLPRTRDFRGLSKKGFDGHGNFSLGLRENVVFPEITQEDTSTSFGLEISIVTNADNDERAYKLLKEFGFPFKD